MRFLAPSVLSFVVCVSSALACNSDKGSAASASAEVSGKAALSVSPTFGGSVLVVGEHPVIQPGAAYDYVSGCPLTTPTGWMEGSYAMLEGAGQTLEVRIPRFALAAPAVSG